MMADNVEFSQKAQPASAQAGSASSDGLLDVNVVAADRPLWHGKARSATIPATSGGMGILPQHEPILTVLEKGRVTIVELDGTRRSFMVDDGFASFDSNRLTVAVERGEELNASQNASE
ncbi:ATP synthase F1 subcomplex epsilon subunit [Bifidobacterium bohemicum]|nr:ATP synthase F1 subcomplex epsilon subunit [Bifidobacterium bohemicum]